MAILDFLSGNKLTELDDTGGLLSYHEEQSTGAVSQMLTALSKDLLQGICWIGVFFDREQTI
jgi:hypothetical protein